MKEKNILVVEDDLHMRVFITTVLETSGYNATATKDGQEGIRKVKEDRPDLIILDGLRDPLPDPEAYVEKPPKAEELISIVQKLLADRPVPD